MSDYYRDANPDEDGGLPYYEDEERTPLWRRPAFLGAVTVVVLVCVAVVVAYRRGAEQAANRLPPLVQAESGPAKVKPEDPGGMEVPHQDKLIYDRMAGRVPTEPVEQLLPGPEEPVANPVPSAPPANGQAAQPATPAVPAGSEPPAATAATGAQPGAPVALTPAPDAAGRPAEGTAPPPAGTRFSDLLRQVPKQPAGSAETGPQVAALEPAAQVPPASAATGGGSYFVQLGAVRNEAAAHAEWGRLSRKMPDLLSSRQLTARRVDLAAKGIFYRLQTGPFPDRMAATSLCDRVKARGQGCIVVTP